MEDRLLMTTPFFYPVNPDSRSISGEIWGAAEETSKYIISCVHPTLDSEEKRRDVIEHVQRLICSSIRCKVFPYGSVPLKTYLPDGDIDLTVFSSYSDAESLARGVLAVLQREELNENAKYELKSIQFIDAEVKLVKCLVDNIVIDISFNQLGGLCALCFLEQIDRVVGKDHLLKRSIILIKAWCYYESRILGAHHGLISTYALEMLVLHLFHLFNSSLNGPLEVLYRFLDYFSKFDWENYCISLNGPACRSSLPDIVVEKPENGGTELILSEEFLSNCAETFSVPSTGLETNLRAFCQKHLNIIDPLKENNNLGRSVNRGNFYRICCAFKFGARKLGKILQLPRERIGDEIKKIFANTLETHEPKHGPALIFDVEDFSLVSSPIITEPFLDDELYLRYLSLRFDEDMAEFEDLFIWRWIREQSKNNTPDSSSSNSNLNGVLCAQNYDASDFSSISSTENGNICHDNGSDSVHDGSGSNSWSEPKDNHLVAGNTVNRKCMSSSDLAISSPDANISETSSLDFDGETETLNPLSDLCGDNDGHIRNLLHARCCHGYALSSRVTRSQPTPLRWDPRPQVNTNGTFVGPPVYAATSSPSSVAFGSEERPKTRGTGTFIPNPRPLLPGRVQMASGACNAWRSIPSIAGLEMQSPKPAMGKKQDGNAEKLFHLRNEV